MKNNDSISVMIDNSRFWPGKYYKTHDSVLQQRRVRHHQHFILHHQQKIMQLQWHCAHKKHSQSQAIQQNAARLSQPFAQALNALKEKTLAFDRLMQQFDQLVQERLIPALSQAQINRANGARFDVTTLITSIRQLMQTYGTQHLVAPAWQKAFDHLATIPMQTMAMQHSTFLDFSRQCQVAAKIATAACQRDTWRLHHKVTALKILLQRLESLNERMIMAPADKLSTTLASMSSSVGAGCLNEALQPPLALCTEQSKPTHQGL